MRLKVNGEERELPPEISVRDLLSELKVAAPRIAVEINRHIVPKARYSETALREGDCVEIVGFVGGG